MVVPLATPRKMPWQRVERWLGLRMLNWLPPPMTAAVRKSAHQLTMVGSSSLEVGLSIASQPNSLCTSGRYVRGVACYALCVLAEQKLGTQLTSGQGDVYNLLCRCIVTCVWGRFHVEVDNLSSPLSLEDQLWVQRCVHCCIHKLVPKTEKTAQVALQHV